MGVSLVGDGLGRLLLVGMVALSVGLGAAACSEQEVGKKLRSGTAAKTTTKSGTSEKSAKPERSCKTPQEIAVGLVEALAAGDKKAFSACFPTADDFMASFMSSPAMEIKVGMQAKQHNMTLTEFAARMAQRNTADKIEQSWWRLKGFGVSFDGATLVSTDKETHETYESSGMEKATFTIVMKLKDGQNITFDLDECVMLPRGWLMTGDVDSVRVGGPVKNYDMPPKENKPEHPEHEAEKASDAVRSLMQSKEYQDKLKELLGDDEDDEDEDEEDLDDLPPL